MKEAADQFTSYSLKIKAVCSDFSRISNCFIEIVFCGIMQVFWDPFWAVFCHLSTPFVCRLAQFHFVVVLSPLFILLRLSQAGSKKLPKVGLKTLANSSKTPELAISLKNLDSTQFLFIRKSYLMFKCEKLKITNVRL